MQENWLPLNQIFKAATAFAEFFVYKTKCVAPKIKIKVIKKIYVKSHRREQSKHKVSLIYVSELRKRVFFHRILHDF